MFVFQTLSESFFKQGQFGDEISDGIHEGVIGGVVGGGLDTENHLVLHGMGVLVAGKQHIGVLQQLLPDEKVFKRKSESPG